MATLKVPDRVTDLGAFVREQRESARLSLRQLAHVAGVSNPYLSQIERGLRKPSAEVLTQIAKGLQISAEALFLRAGLLEESSGVEVEVAVQSDVRLTARQKRVLLDIYATFRAENARENGTGAGPAGRSGTVVALMAGSLKSRPWETDQATKAAEGHPAGTAGHGTRTRVSGRPPRSRRATVNEGAAVTTPPKLRRVASSGDPSPSDPSPSDPSASR